MNRNRIAHFQEGSSDKIYMVGIANTTITNGKYQVVAKWGRRGGNFQVQVKSVHNRLSDACKEMNDIIDLKLAKGYEDIEASSYRGSVTLASLKHLLQADDEDDQKVQASAAKGMAKDMVKIAEELKDDVLDEALANSSRNENPSKSRSIKVRCINNSGIEGQLDVDAEYVAWPHPDSDMLFVVDNTGTRDEFFAKRFIKVRS